MTSTSSQLTKTLCASYNPARKTCLANAEKLGMQIRAAAERPERAVVLDNAAGLSDPADLCRPTVATTELFSKTQPSPGQMGARGVTRHRSHSRARSTSLCRQA